MQESIIMSCLAKFQSLFMYSTGCQKKEVALEHTMPSFHTQIIIFIQPVINFD
jgi:hypothetical protein